MSFGFKSVNDDSYVQIDSESPRLCWLEGGSYGGSTYQVNITFAKVVTTDEPPMVFIHPAPGASASMLGQMFLNGTAGAWTGFTLRARNVNYVPTGTWFVAAFASVAEADYGMRLFDESGAVIYDTGAPAVIVTDVRSNWVYQGTTQVNEIGQISTWTISRGLADGEYMMINNYALLTLSSINNASWTGLSATSTQTSLFLNGLGNWINTLGHRPVLYARLNY